MFVLISYENRTNNLLKINGDTNESDKCLIDPIKDICYLNRSFYILSSDFYNINEYYLENDFQLKKVNSYIIPFPADSLITFNNEILAVSDQMSSSDLNLLSVKRASLLKTIKLPWKHWVHMNIVGTNRNYIFVCSTLGEPEVYRIDNYQITRGGKISLSEDFYNVGEKLTYLDTGAQTVYERTIFGMSYSEELGLVLCVGGFKDKSKRLLAIYNDDLELLYQDEILSSKLPISAITSNRDNVYIVSSGFPLDNHLIKQYNIAF